MIKKSVMSIVVIMLICAGVAMALPPGDPPPPPPPVQLAGIVVISGVKHNSTTDRLYVSASYMANTEYGESVEYRVRIRPVGGNWVTVESGTADGNCPDGASICAEYHYAGPNGTIPKDDETPRAYEAQLLLYTCTLEDDSYQTCQVFDL